MFIAIIFWLGFSAAVGYAAQERFNRSPGGWGLIALVISPILAALFLAISGEKENRTYDKTQVRLFKGEEPIGYRTIGLKGMGSEIKLEVDGETQFFKNVDYIPEDEDRSNFYHYAEKGHPLYGDRSRIDDRSPDEEDRTRIDQ